MYINGSSNNNFFYYSWLYLIRQTQICLNYLKNRLKVSLSYIQFQTSRFFEWVHTRPIFLALRTDLICVYYRYSICFPGLCEDEHLPILKTSKEKNYSLQSKLIYLLIRYLPTSCQKASNTPVTAVNRPLMSSEPEVMAFLPILSWKARMIRQAGRMIREEALKSRKGEKPRPDTLRDMAS